MCRWLLSSLGRKYIMAITGLLLTAFVIVHMLGNLNVFVGADALNHYSKLLQQSRPMLWTFRIGLLTVALLHVVTAFSLYFENKKARPIGYARKRTIQATFASLTMAVTGSVVLIFIVYHILHFTVMAFHPEYREMKTTIQPASALYQVLAPVHDGEQDHDVFRMVTTAFSNPWIAIFYIVAVGFLCMHMSHGVGSMFQSLGLRTPRTAAWTDAFSRWLALAIFVGMAIVPASILIAAFRDGTVHGCFGFCK